MLWPDSSRGCKSEGIRVASSVVHEPSGLESFKSGGASSPSPLESARFRSIPLDSARFRSSLLAARVESSPGANRARVLESGGASSRLVNNTSGKDGKEDNETPRDDGTRSLFLGTL